MTSNGPWQRAPAPFSQRLSQCTLKVSGRGKGASGVSSLTTPPPAVGTAAIRTGLEAENNTT